MLSTVRLRSSSSRMVGLRHAQNIGNQAFGLLFQGEDVLRYRLHAAQEFLPIIIAKIAVSENLGGNSGFILLLL